jgi:uncharacterized coiled-coil DUF342 family protein
MAVMAREAWTDERLDDLAGRMDENFREVRSDIRELRSGLDSVKGEVGELREEVGELRGEMKAGFATLNRTLQIGFALMGTFLVALVGLLGTQL